MSNEAIRRASIINIREITSELKESNHWLKELEKRMSGEVYTNRPKRHIATGIRTTKDIIRMLEEELAEEYME